MVEVSAQEGGDGRRAHREPAENVGCGLGRYAEVALQHVGGEALEGEDGRIVEHAEERDDPEHLAAQDVLQVADLELLLAAASAPAVETQLFVQFAVHEGEDHERQQADQQQHGAECHRSYDRCGSHVGEPRRNGEDGENADAGNGHLKSHGQSHLLAFEPLGDRLRNGDAGHLHTASEYHEPERCEFGTGRERYPPAIEPSLGASADEGVAHAVIFDAGADKHQGCREHSREAHTHFVEDDTCQDQESEDIEDELRTSVHAEHVGRPAALCLDHALQGRHHVHEHVAEEHRQCDQDERRPPHPGRVVEFPLDNFRHNYLFLS